MLDIHTDSPELGTVSITLFQSPSKKGSPLDAPKVEEAARLAGAWSARLQKMMDYVARLETTPAPQVRAITLEDKIGALWVLVQQGALTMEEFESRKKQLLGAA